MQRILLAEDDEKLRAQLIDLLTAREFVVEPFEDGLSALAFGQNQKFDLAVIDLGLPRLPGLEVVKGLRAAGIDHPVLILTARGDWQDKVEVLGAGADDYLVKPFHIEELVARLGALSRRAEGGLQSEVKVGDLTVDVRAQQIKIAGEALELTAYEFSLLQLFARRPGEILSKNVLADHLYRADMDRDSNVIEVFVGRLRRKLASVCQTVVIETLRGQGYRLVLKAIS